MRCVRTHSPPSTGTRTPDARPLPVLLNLKLRPLREAVRRGVEVSFFVEQLFLGNWINAIAVHRTEELQVIPVIGRPVLTAMIAHSSYIPY